MTCQRYIKIAYAIKGPKQALVTRLRCKQWDCDYCAKKNANMWLYWLIKRLPVVSDNWYFMTLTANEDIRGHVESLTNIRANIDRLIKRMKRVFGDNIEYVRVFEKHPSSDACHVHFVISGLDPYVQNGYSVKHQLVSVGVINRKSRFGCWSLNTWIKKTCKDLGMGYIADVQKIEGDMSKVAYYVCKYLTKEQQQIHVAYLRHVQVTQGIGKPEFENSYEWTPASYITARTFDEPNTQIEDIDTGFIIDNNYWEHTGFYPDEVTTSKSD